MILARFSDELLLFFYLPNYDKDILEHTIVVIYTVHKT